MARGHKPDADADTAAAAANRRQYGRAQPPQQLQRQPHEPPQRAVQQAAEGEPHDRAQQHVHRRLEVPRVGLLRAQQRAEQRARRGQHARQVGVRVRQALQRLGGLFCFFVCVFVRFVLFLYQT